MIIHSVVSLGSPDHFLCERCGRTASDKSWAWRPGNEATENQLLIRHFRGSPAFPATGSQEFKVRWGRLIRMWLLHS